MTEYAIVDIETTGGSADRSGITEIAIIVWDGNAIVQRFSSLVNPEMPIPLGIQSLTGIDDDMVADAPVFDEIAETIHSILSNRVFVAHNVHFDYSFVHYFLSKSGLDLKCKKLCTVRLSRKILPGIPSYSLGRLTEYLKIPHFSKHRAGGDADATVILFSYLQSSDHQNLIEKSLKQESSLGKFPPKLKPEDISALPELPGVYFFKDEKGKVIYVGKAINIKKRIVSHFSNNSTKKQKQEFIQKIARIQTEVYSTELMALIYESHEIKRLWPELNRAQKHREDTLGLFDFIDQNGYKRLGIDKIKKSFPSNYTFNNYLTGIELLRLLCANFDLEPSLCFLGKKKVKTQNLGILEGTSMPLSSLNPLKETKELPPAEEYNRKVEMAIQYLRKDRSFAILDKAFEEHKQSCILILRGESVGMGYIPKGVNGSTILKYTSQLKPLKLNGFIRQSLLNFSVQNPDRISYIAEDDLSEFESKRNKIHDIKHPHFSSPEEQSVWKSTGLFHETY